MPVEMHRYPFQLVPEGQLVVLVTHLSPSKKVPMGQAITVVVRQSVPFHDVPGGHKIGTHLRPFQVCPEEQLGFKVHWPLRS